MAYFFLIVYLAVQYIQPAIKSSAIAAFRPALVVGSLLALATVLKLFQSGRRMVFPHQSKLFLGLIALMTVSLVQAENKQDSLWVLVVMVTNFAVYWIMTQVVNTPAKLRGFLYAFVAIHVWVGVDGIRAFYSTIGGKEAAKGLKGVLQNFLGNSNDYALAMVVALPFAYFLLLRSRSSLAKVAFLGTMMVFATGIMSTLSRGGQLGLAAVIAAIGIKSGRKVPVLVVSFCLVLLFGLFAPQKYWGRVGSIADYKEDSSARNRFYTWLAGLEMGLTNPILGVGPGSYVTAYRRGGYRDARPEGIGRNLFTAHSIYFQILAELGLTGVWICLLMVLANFRTCRGLLERVPAGKSGDPADDIVSTVAAACQVSLVGFLVSGTFLSAAYYPHFWYLTGFVAVAESLAHERAPIPSARSVAATGLRIVPARVRA